MSSTALSKPAPGSMVGQSVRRMLGALRWRIRAYVWLEGLALALIWLGATFWIGLMLDYLPILFWASEIPLAGRMIGLAITALVLGWILYRWILRRAFAPLPDASMALLLERAHPDLKDTLLTTVELSRRSADDVGRSDMLAHTAALAERQAGGLEAARVFNGRPLMAKWIAAICVCVPVAVFALWQTPAFATWVGRFYGMQDTPWPRSARVAAVGVRVRRRGPGEPQARYSELTPFENKRLKVGRGARLELRVSADTTQPATPEFCTVYYRHKGGARGKALLNPFGQGENEQQLYATQDKPFDGLQKTLVFHVQGLDHRVNGYEIEVVEPPLAVATELQCVFPDYLVDAESGAWTARTVPYVVGGVQLPEGTQTTIRVMANKSVARAIVFDQLSGATTTVDPLDAARCRELGREPGRVIEFPAAPLKEEALFEIAFVDEDGVASESPHQVRLSPQADTPPDVEVQLVGIGALVTPKAQLPYQGTVGDDHRVAETWFDIQINQQPAKRRVNVAWDSEGGVDQPLDLRAESSGSPPIALQPKDTLVVSVMASDAYNLSPDGQPNVGSGGRTELTVVTEDELLQDLDRKELAQRRRLTHVVEECTQMRDSLARVARQIRGDQAGADPGDVLDGEEGEEDQAKAEERAESLRKLRVQQAGLQAEKSAQEVLGIAGSLERVVLELVNNRVDSEDRQKRLREQVADRLTEIADSQFPPLMEDLKALADRVAADPDNGVFADRVLAQSDEILARLNDVLDKMLDIETYNELVDLLRNLLEEQEKISDATKSERAKAALDLLK